MQNALKQPHLSEADYLRAEQCSTVKHEYAAGQVFAMSGASIVHNQIALNVAIALRNATSGCRVSISDVKFKAAQLYYYPDVMVTCEPKSDDYCETQPCLVAEVLSDTTESVDRGEKLYNYQKVPELDAYLLISQKEQRVDIYQRDGGGWRFSTLTDGAFELQCPPVTLTIDGIYQGVTLANAEAASAN